MEHFGFEFEPEEGPEYASCEECGDSYAVEDLEQLGPNWNAHYFCHDCMQAAIIAQYNQDSESES